MEFRTELGKTIFEHKYKHDKCETWEKLCDTLVEDVCRHRMSFDEKTRLKKYFTEMKAIAGGRFLYYAGRDVKFFNNCYVFISKEDSRESWADLSWKAEMCLTCGGGIGNDYSIYRGKGSLIKRTGGIASGPIAKIEMINEIGRKVMQGGSRRSAIYASLNWKHADIEDFLHCKDWNKITVAGAYDENGNQHTVGSLKEKDFNYPAPLDMTNVSVNYDNSFLEEVYELPIDEIETRLKNGEELEIKKIPYTFLENIRQAMKTGEPGFSFNFFDKENETGRNACTEVTSSDDSDVCNLASINLAYIESIEELEDITELVSKFLLCNTLVAELPFEKIYKIREKNRRLGLGLMGIHEWLLKRGYKYEVVPELKDWLRIFKNSSESAANQLADELQISRPIAYRAVAPTGTLSLLCSTSQGIEPLFAVAYKRRYLKGDKQWNYQYVIDGMSKLLIKDYNLKPEEIETALHLAKDPERRIKFQADIQDYIDQSISSTINLPSWGTDWNNEQHVRHFAKLLIKYCHRLRGFTCYPDGARGGQPITPVDYEYASKLEGQEFTEEFMDVCDLTHSGSCGI